VGPLHIRPIISLSDLARMPLTSTRYLDKVAVVSCTMEENSGLAFAREMV
jgi:hypothetical protein